MYKICFTLLHYWMSLQMLICDFHGNTNKLEIYRDVVDATIWVFSKEASIRVVRGW